MGRYIVGPAEDGREYVYGPVPPQAVTVRLRTVQGTTRDLPTAALPSGLADGRYFFTVIEQGTLIESVLPLDASGEPVALGEF